MKIFVKYYLGPFFTYFCTNYVKYQCMFFLTKSEMTNEITLGKLKTQQNIHELLALQKKNLKKNISQEELEKEGFVTVEHNFEKLEAMHKSLPQIVAYQQNKVIAYALSMPVTFKNIIPELTPMCELLDTLIYKGKKLAQYKYYIMGQICIDKSVRGQGVFQKLYLQHAVEFSDKFDFIVTEVSINNKRSMRAHEKVGFINIHEYFDKENDDTWAVVLWDFTIK
jgi:Acetyltransferase (GNAT) family